MTGWHVVRPASERLSTLAGVWFLDVPATLPPEAHVMPAAMSCVVPPHLPSTRTCWTLTPRAFPTTPLASLTAAIVPATWVPCQLEPPPPEPLHSPGEVQSPWSLGFESRPSPSRGSTHGAQPSLLGA